MKYDYYKWQLAIINHEGDLTIRGGRQEGKSVSVAELINKRAEDYPNEISLIIGASERQEDFLFENVKEIIGDNYVGRSTKTLIKLSGGHKIYKYPVGESGKYLEGLSNVAFLYVEEAIHVKDRAIDSILPMLAEPRSRGLGWKTYLSSTMGKPKGFFFDSFKNKGFTHMQIKAEDCSHLSKEFLAEELERLGEIRFNVVYNAEFDENANKYFPKELIQRAITIGNFQKKDISATGEYYGGLDPATSGIAKAAWATVRIVGPRTQIIHGEEMQKSTFTEMRSKTIDLFGLFNYKKFFYDNNGLGQGFDEFFERYKPIRRRLRGLNNAEAGKYGKILKEDLYSNLLGALEENEVDIVNDQIIINGLEKVEVEGPPGEEKIIGTDMSEAIVRAFWGRKEKYIKSKIYRF